MRKVWDLGVPGTASPFWEAFCHPGNAVTQGTDAGFIKFGSRVDLYLPLGTKVNVKLGDKVKGGVQVVAEK